jgi:hypothetical protein
MRFQPGFRYGASQAVIAGALALLAGETDGFAIDATTYDSVTAAAYVGGPVGGTVAVIDTGTPANDLSDVPLDASNLVQSGTSPKMVHHAASPYVRWSAHNLHLRSQEFATTWNTSNVTVSADALAGPDGTTTADRATGSGADWLLYSNNSTIDVALTAGFVYTFSVFAKYNNRQFLRFLISNSDFAQRQDSYFDIQNGATGSNTIVGTDVVFVSEAIADAGGGWYRCQVTVAINNSADYGFVFSATTTDGGAGASGAIVELWGAQVNRGPIATPYLATTTTARIGIPQSYDAAAAQYGILVEPAATNLCLRSEDIATIWTNSNTTESTNATAAPDAQTTADKVVEASDTAQVHSIGQSISVTSGTAYTFSCYLKQGERTWARLSAGTTRFADNFHCDFNLSAGTEGTNGAGATNAGIESVGNGWYRCFITATADSTGAETFSVVIGEGDTDVTYNGDGSSGIYIWGAQVESGPVATSYIPTLGSTVTRAVDNVNALVSTMPWSATEGTVYADYLPSVATGTQVVWHADDGTGDERIYQYRGTSDPLVSVIDGGVNQLAPLDLGTITGGARSQTTFAWKANDFAGSHGGAAIVADTGGTIPTMTTFRLGTDQGSSQLNGLIKRLVWVPRRVVDGDLPTWRYNF